MTGVAPATVLSVDDPHWDDEVAGSDPHLLRPFAAAHAADGERAVLLLARGDGWTAREVMLLQQAGPACLLARAPLYGGPWLQVDDPGDIDVVALAARQALDAALRGLGVASRVAVFSPWLPHVDAVPRTWQARPGKAICLARLGDAESRWAALAADRRSEIRRADRDGEVRWTAFDTTAAARFADVYAGAMEALDAAPRWRLSPTYFQRLAAEAGGHLHLATAETPTGGAAALVLDDGRRAAYLYAARWGRAPGASSAALWRAQSESARRGIDEMLLGGGVGEAPDDPLLRFKRAFADRELPLLLAAGAFDRKAHDAAAAQGLARPLPEVAVDL